MEIEFHGAAGMVTGSCLKLSTPSLKILVDCGMFQGLGVEKLNYDPFNFNAGEIDYVFLTHAHLDHCGRLPKLFRSGFRGKIILTQQTAEITKVILRDAAKIQRLNKLVHPEKLMYTIEDVEETLKLFNVVQPQQTYSLDNNCSYTLQPVGHILGAVSIVLKHNNNEYVFSGDIGRIDQGVIKTFTDYDFSGIQPRMISMESLYGGVEHESRDKNILEIARLINETLAKGGKVVVPLFALQRTQEVLEMFKLLFYFKMIPPDVKVYLDSPMAIAITDIYQQNITEFNNRVVFNGYDCIYGENSSDGFLNENRFRFMQLKELKKSKASKQITNHDRSIILAGSGMAEGGRVVRHLANLLDNPVNSVIFVGYQGEGTLGRKLVDGETSVEINGVLVEVRATISYLRGFSAHGDNTDLLSWMQKFDLNKLQTIFLCHAEPERLAIFKNLLSGMGYNVVVAELFKAYQLD